MNSVLKRSSRTLLAALGMLVALAGCKAIAPGPRDLSEALPDVPLQWAATNEGSSGVDGRWLSRFKDPRLDALVAEAVASNHDLRLSALQLEIALRDAKLAGVAMRPTATLNLLGQRQQQNFAGSPFGNIFSGADPNAEPGSPESMTQEERGGAPAVFETDTFGISFDIDWELDLWGRIRAGRSAAVAAAQATGLDLQAARISLSAQVAKAYFALAEAEAQVALAEENLRLAESTEELIRDRYESGDEAGGGVLAQLRLAETDRATTKASVAQQKALRDQIARQLERILGRHPAGKLRVGRALPAPPKTPPAGLPSGLLLRRPDILAAERRWAAQGMRVREAQLALFPRLALTGSLGTSTDELGSVLDPDFTVWNLAGNLAQVVLTGGQLRAERDKRSIEEEASMVSLQRTVVTAFSEVENALAAERWLAQRTDALAEASRHAAEAVTEAGESYRSGTGDILTLLTAQGRQLQTRSQLLSLQRLRLDNRVDLHLALGGDFKVHPPKATVAE